MGSGGGREGGGPRVTHECDSRSTETKLSVCVCVGGGGGGGGLCGERMWQPGRPGLRQKSTDCAV